MQGLSHHDFETYSTADLKVVGADAYAEHASTGVHCLAYTFGADDAPQIWAPHLGEPSALLAWIEAGKPIACWNSAFEESIWRHTIARLYPRWPQPKLEQFHDIMTWALAASLPAALGECASALGLPERKDAAGSRIMMSLAKPRKVKSGDLAFWTRDDAPEKFERLYGYGKQDVITERAIAAKVRPLSSAEREVWLLDRRINRRGVRLDLDAIAAAMNIAASEADRLNSEMCEVTGGAVQAATNVGALTAWLQGKGLNVAGVTKANVTDLLANNRLPNDARAALLIRQEAGKASTAKFKRMAQSISSDGRARDLFQYHGSTTGRWAGRRIQPQNMPRPNLSANEVAECIDLFGEWGGADMIRYGYGKPLDVLSWCLRGVLVPAPGRVFVGGDFASIEGRVLAWLAGETWKLDAFRDYDLKIGPDLYNVAYGRAFGIDPAAVSKPQRQIGKVMELALGYQGGVGAFRTMAAGYGVDLDRMAGAIRDAATQDAWDKAEKKRLWLQIEHKMHVDLAPETYTAIRLLVDAWRAAQPATKAFWADIESCAMTAVLNAGSQYATATGLLTWACGKDFLYCRLPSGRILSYARPSLIWVKNQFTKKDQQVLQYFAAGKDRKNTSKKKFEAVTSYGGLLAENVTQAVARDVLVGAMIRMEKKGLPIVLHVHDEARAEVPRGTISDEDCAVLMRAAPPWAGGLPLAVECETLERYHK